MEKVLNARNYVKNDFLTHRQILKLELSPSQQWDRIDTFLGFSWKMGHSLVVWFSLGHPK